MDNGFIHLVSTLTFTPSIPLLRGQKRLSKGPGVSSLPVSHQSCTGPVESRRLPRPPSKNETPCLFLPEAKETEREMEISSPSKGNKPHPAYCMVSRASLGCKNKMLSLLPTRWHRWRTWEVSLLIHRNKHPPSNSGHQKIKEKKKRISLSSF